MWLARKIPGDKSSTSTRFITSIWVRVSLIPSLIPNILLAQMFPWDEWGYNFEDNIRNLVLTSAWIKHCIICIISPLYLVPSYPRLLVSFVVPYWNLFTHSPHPPPTTYILLFFYNCLLAIYIVVVAPNPSHKSHFFEVSLIYLRKLRLRIKSYLFWVSIKPPARVKGPAFVYIFLLLQTTENWAIFKDSSF